MLAISAQFQEEYHCRYLRPDSENKPDLSEFRSEDYMDISLGEGCSICNSPWVKDDVLTNRWHWLTCKGCSKREGRPQDHAEVAALFRSILWDTEVKATVKERLRGLALDLIAYNRGWTTLVRNSQVRRRTI